MEMPGRSYNSSAGRYGFNGKEKDPEFGNNYDYGFRIYNANIAKFLSVDPLGKKYPQLTSYQFASNNPIFNIDLDGLEGFNAQELLFKSWSETSGYPIPGDINTPEGSKRYGMQMVGAYTEAYVTVVGLSLPIEEVVGAGFAVAFTKAAPRLGKIFSLAKGSDIILKVAKDEKIVNEVVKTTLIEEKAASRVERISSKGKPNPIPQTSDGFMVTNDGTAMHKNIDELRTSLDNAGFSSAFTNQTSERGVVHTITTQNKTVAG